MKKIQLLICVSILACLTLISCKTTKPIPTPPDDITFAYSSSNPVKVAGLIKGDVASVGGDRVTTYLKSLRGGSGQKVSSKRIESCCTFNTTNSPTGKGQLEVWEVSSPGLNTKRIYINAYEEGPIKAPKGFTLAQ